MLGRLSVFHSENRMNGSQVVSKLWNYCHVLRDDGLSYQDYLEQLTFLLFLKMAHERTQTPYNQPSPIRDGVDSLASTPSVTYDMVLTNPPFGKLALAGC